MPQDRKWLVVVADAGRARLYELGREEARPGETVPRLREAATLRKPERRAQDSQVFSDTRPGLRRGVPGGAGHGVDDRRDQHVAEWDRQFASEILEAIADRLRNGPARVVVAASPHMLGLLRGGFERLGRAGADVIDLPKDLTKLTPTELHDHLASGGLLPPRRPSP
jgi:protein required for attachment to host cells